MESADARASGAGSRPAARGLRHSADGPHGDPIAELILTVLSQSTNDRNRDVAYLRLRERLPDRLGGRARRARGRGRGGDPPGRHLEGQVGSHPGDPARDRRRRSQARVGSTCAGTADRWSGVARAAAGRASRDYLCLAPGRRAQDGRVRAAVLLWAARRAGRHACLACRHAPWPVRAGAPFEELHDQMLALTPPGQELELHVNLLRHGRRTCHARTPACRECALARMCPSRVLPRCSRPVGPRGT